MCPFCSLITPRSRRPCFERGKESMARPTDGQLCSFNFSPGQETTRESVTSAISGDRVSRFVWESRPLLVQHPQNRIVPARIFLHSLAENGACLGSGDGLLCDSRFASRFWAGFTLNTK